jgi:hypothetical protein
MAVVQLLMGVLRRVHANPELRNIYVNPRRADQALIYIPDCWVTRPLDEAGQVMFGRIARVLGCLPKITQQDVQDAASGVRQSCAQHMPQLAKASRGVLSAHLENVRQLTIDGCDWLGTRDDSGELLSYFGDEWTGHLTPGMLITAAEAASGDIAVADAAEQTRWEQTSRALLQCAQYVLYGQPVNLTLLPFTDDEVYVHQHKGWVVQSRLSTAIELLRRIAAILDDQLDGVARTPLTVLRPWLRERFPEFVRSPSGAATAERIMTCYLISAERYYGGLPRTADKLDRREAARSLLAASSATLPAVPTTTIDRMGPGPPGRIILMDDELDELLGFSL